MQMARTQTKDEPETEPAYGSNTVTVVCKLPHGIWLQLHEWGESIEPHPLTGTRTVKVARKVGKPILIKGYRGLPFTGPIPGIETNCGYALTPGVPKDFWEKWLEQNKSLLIVKNELIFAHNDKASVKDFTRGNETVICGFEPIDPDNPNRKLNGKSASQSEKNPDAKSRLAISAATND
jgi:hypothetical protein